MNVKGRGVWKLEGIGYIPVAGIFEVSGDDNMFDWTKPRPEKKLS